MCSSDLSALRSARLRPTNRTHEERQRDVSGIPTQSLKVQKRKEGSEVLFQFCGRTLKSGFSWTDHTIGTNCRWEARRLKHEIAITNGLQGMQKSAAQKQAESARSAYALLFASRVLCVVAGAGYAN